MSIRFNALLSITVTALLVSAASCASDTGPTSPTLDEPDANSDADDNVDTNDNDNNADNTRVGCIDADGDGVPAVSPSCSEAIRDCDDDDPARYPGNAEVCDGVDNDCNDVVDDGALMYTFYRDADGDGFGNPSQTKTRCDEAPEAGFVADNRDCDDENDDIYPGHEDVCDGRDNDCDVDIDEDFVPQTCGVGACAVETACAMGAAPDCAPLAPPSTDDADGDGVDSDCDGEIDEDTSFGACSTSGEACLGDDDCVPAIPIEGFCIQRQDADGSACIYDTRFTTEETRTCAGHTLGHCATGFDCPTGMQCGSYASNWCLQDAIGVCSYGINAPPSSTCLDDADCTITDRPNVCVICGDGVLQDNRGACSRGCVQEQCDLGDANGALCSTTCQHRGVCHENLNPLSGSSCHVAEDCNSEAQCSGGASSSCTCEGSD